MTVFRHLSLQIDERGIATVIIDAAGRSMNVFDDEMLQEMEHVVTLLSRQPGLTLIVFRSGKPSGFIAGADVGRIQAIPSREVALELARRGQQLFDRIENLPAPTVAVVHGPCLGGGLEFALACRYRIAIDALSTRIGLPETQLGLIPGWGGTQRLPRTVGLKAAVPMILEGQRLTAVEAVRLGLVDTTVAESEVERELPALLEQCRSQVLRRPGRTHWSDWLLNHTRVGRWLLFKAVTKRLGRQALHYPALTAAMTALKAGQRSGFAEGLHAEREQFSHVLFSPTTRNLLELFFQRERARNIAAWVPKTHNGVIPIETVAVVGGGTMGAGIAQLALTRGYRVVLKELTPELAEAGRERIGQLMGSAVRKGAINRQQVDQMWGALTMTSEWGPVREADLVIEAIVERLDIKQQLFADLDSQLPERVVLASNTSALPISQLAHVTEHPDRVAGLHFFNPVHKMPLVEVVRSRQTSDKSLIVLLEFAKSLGKTPLLVEEGPGFLVNRVLFPYLDEAVRMVLEGIPASEVDRSAKQFGMPMGPLELIDTVGVDIAADVAVTLNPLTHDPSPTTEFLRQMVEHRQLGRKTGIGFYHYRDGRRGKDTDLKITQYVKATHIESLFVDGEEFDGIQLRLIGALLNAAAGTLRDQIVHEAWMVDLGMVLGTGFPAFRGGPMRLAETWGDDLVREQLHMLADRLGPRFHPSDWFKEHRPAEDFRAHANAVR